MKGKIGGRRYVSRFLKIVVLSFVCLFLIAVIMTVLPTPRGLRKVVNRGMMDLAPNAQESAGFVKTRKDVFVSDKTVSTDGAAPSYVGGIVPAPEIAPTDTKDRKIVRTATLELETTDLEDAQGAAEQVASKYSGYVINSSLYTPSDSSFYSPGLTISIRVPVGRFSAAVAALKETGRVISANTQGDDVTDEYVDLKSRLKNLEATEDQLLVIMDKATKISDILNVQNQINSVREQIEVIKGQMQYLDKSSELSTITATYSLKLGEADPGEPGWDPLATAKNAFDLLVSAGQSFVDLVIMLVILSPVLLAPVLVIVLLVRLIKKLMEKVGAKKTEK